MENIFWTARTSKPRHEAINQIKNVVGRYGNIMGFNLFSDVSLSMTIELEERKVDRLYLELVQHIGINPVEPLDSSSTLERTLYLHINFVTKVDTL